MGTMQEADNKATKRFLIVATAIVALIFSMVYFNIPASNLGMWHAKAAPFWKATGWVPFAGSIFFMWFKQDSTWGEKGGWQYGAVAIGLLALGIFMGCGWTFDL